MARWPYGTKQWRYIRLAKLGATPMCEHCGGVANQVDHIVPIEDGGLPFDMDNLQSLCQRCHSAKTAMADGGFGNRRGKWRVRGCRLDGTPLDPRHEWNKGRNLPRRRPKNRALLGEES